MRFSLGILIAGTVAGAITGLFGAGGGMMLIPLLTLLTDIQERELFPCSISTILPICLVCLFFTAEKTTLPFQTAFPYLLGSGIGGVIAGITGQKIPTLWLHRGLGILIFWGGWRYLWA